MSRLLHLYPAGWRERYEAEVEDLLEARPPSVRDRLDLIRGALDAWRHPQIVKASAVPEAENRSWGRSAGTILAVLGGGAWVAGGIVMKTARYDEFGNREAVVAWLLLVLGAFLTGAATFAVGRSLGRPSRAVVICGASMVTFSLVMLVPWPVLVIGFFGYLIAAIGFGGSLLAAEARPIGIVLVIAALAMFSFNTENDRALIAIPFGVVWILIGLLALRARPVGEPAPAGG